jgi:dTMP kinase
MSGLFITFEGSEGSGKSTQVARLATHLTELGHKVRVVREPGSTPIGEEIRHTLKHSQQNHAMTAETELLLMNACRAQLVREVIRPALAAGEIVISDRYYDSSTAYQGYGRELDLKFVKTLIDFAVGDTRPRLTIFLKVPSALATERVRSRQVTLPFVRDRIEEADRLFFERVAQGFEAVAAAEPQRVKVLDAGGTMDEVSTKIWKLIEPLLSRQHSK